MNRKSARWAIRAAIVAWVCIAPSQALAQLLPPLPGGSLIVTITSPSSGSTVSGTVAVSASVTIVGSLTVAGVQFKLDGANLGGEDASAPYSVSWNTKGTNNGSHTLTAVARDLLGLTFTSNPVVVTVFNDSTPPSATITSPANGATVSASINVTANASDNVGVAGVQFRLDGASLGAEDGSAPYSVSWNTTTVGNGSHTLTAIARDTTGNQSTSAPVTVTVFNDTTPPSVAIASPANGSTLSGTVNVTATASDNVGVAGVQFRLDGANLGGEDISAPYSVSWNTTTVGNGSHTLTAVARDTKGNQSTSSPVTVSVFNDSTPPTVTINQAAGQLDPTNASPINFTVVFSEPVSGFTGTDITISGTAGGTMTVTVTGSGSSYNAAVSGMSSSGTVIATIAAGLAQDAAGNGNSGSTSTDNTVTFNLPDTTAPTVNITSPANGATVSGTITVNASATDAGGVTLVQFLLDGQQVGALDDTAPYEAVWDTQTVPDGSHTLQVKAQDTAGNIGASSTITLTVSNGPIADTTPPSVTMTAPAGGTTVSGTIMVSADATDNAGVAGVQFRVDGVALAPEDIAAPYSTSWDTTTVTDGPHTLTAVARDAAGNVSTSADVTVGVSNGGTTATRSEETAATYSGSGWTLRGPETGTFSADAAATSNVAGDASTFTFTGTSVSWIGLKCSACGIAGVSIDGSAAVSVDTASEVAPGSPGLASEVVFTASGLGAGTHSLTITVAGTTTSSDAHIVIDAFDVTGAAGGPTAARIEDSDPAVTYAPAGDWVFLTDPRATGGTAVESQVAGATAALVFAGTEVRWIGYHFSGGGIARVSIDGALLGEVDQYSPNDVLQAVTFAATGLARGTHTLTIEVTGTKRAESVNTWILIDAFDVTP